MQGEGVCAESAPAELGEPAGSDEQARRGDLVLHSNAYFTIGVNSVLGRVVARVIPAWCKPDLLGTSLMSKSVVPSDLGATMADPHRAVLVLRAWMLSKFKENGFCDLRADRRRLFARELEVLQRGLRELSGGLLPTAPTRRLMY